MDVSCYRLLTLMFIQVTNYTVNLKLFIKHRGENICLTLDTRNNLSKYTFLITMQQCTLAVKHRKYIESLMILSRIRYYRLITIYNKNMLSYYIFLLIIHILILFTSFLLILYAITIFLYR